MFSLQFYKNPLNTTKETSQPFVSDDINVASFNRFFSHTGAKVVMHSIVDNLMNNTGRTIKRKVEDFLSKKTSKSNNFLNPITPKIPLEILSSGCCTLSWSLENFRLYEDKILLLFDAFGYSHHTSAEQCIYCKENLHDNHFWR